ncbi:hypothetical protein GJAV_G00108270 [Gymnothorax javanicus]|nr:hypothetical protein GJAV_G00108270 [Gymnothorax javanicus]
MLAREILPLSLSFRPAALGHWLLSSLFISFQFAWGELQKSCKRTALNTASESCRLPCPCKPYPPLPPPPPPPPLPRLLAHRETLVPPVESWRKDTVVLGTVVCASAVFLLLAAIIGYKAIKRKPLRKEENGTREYAMSSCNQKTIEINNTRV